MCNKCVVNLRNMHVSGSLALVLSMINCIHDWMNELKSLCILFKKKVHERCFELIIKIKGILYSSHFGKCFGFAVSGYSVHTDCLMWSYRLIINDWSVLLLIQKGTLSGPRWEIWHLVTSSRSISTLMLSICISPQSTYRFHKVTRYYVHYY